MKIEKFENKSWNVPMHKVCQKNLLVNDSNYFFYGTFGMEFIWNIQRANNLFFLSS